LRGVANLIYAQALCKAPENANCLPIGVERCYISPVIVGEQKPTPALRRLLPFPSGSAASVGIPEILNELAAQAHRRKTQTPPQSRPHVLLNMASTTDGRASIEGRAGPIGDRADSALLHGLRTIAEGLLVGAGTVRAEHYAHVLRDEQDRQTRRAHGLSAELPTFIVTGSMRLDPQEVPLLAEPQALVTLITPTEQELAPCPAQPGYLRCERDGKLDLALALHRIHDDHGVGTLLCEGGPHLAAQLLQQGLVDELFLSFTPKIAGGQEHLRIVAGAEIDPPQQLELIALYEHDSSLFLRYRLVR
jgi:riboflavin biosynthesis pyrimidine reductase